MKPLNNLVIIEVFHAVFVGCRQAEERAQTSEGKRSELEALVREQAEKIRALERQVQGVADIMVDKQSTLTTQSVQSTALPTPAPESRSVTIASSMPPAEAEKSVVSVTSKRVKSPRSSGSGSATRSSAKSPRKGGGTSSSQGSAKKK